MKRIIISLLTSIILVLSSYSQWYEYTATSYVNYFNGTELNQIHGSDTTFYFELVSAFGATVEQKDGMLQLNKVMESYHKFHLHLDSISIDISAVPVVYFEAKATNTIPNLVMQLHDTSGGLTYGQYRFDFGTDWQGFEFDVSGSWADETSIDRISINGDDSYTLEDTVWIRHLYVGDTSYKTLTNFNANVVTASQDIQTYPNPVNDILNISGVEIEEVLIMDLTGKVLMIVATDDIKNKINVSDLPSGMYILTVKTENGTIEETFIKE